MNTQPSAVKIWDVNDVAAFLQVSTSWVYKQASAGALPIRRIGGLLRFLPDEIDRYSRGEWEPKKAAPYPAKKTN